MLYLPPLILILPSECQLLLGAMMYQYYIKVVPTWYVQLDGTELHTNQYSVTRHQKV